MTMTRVLVGVVLLVGCNSPGRRVPDAQPDSPASDPGDAYVWPDAAPPPFDAAPLPEMACSTDADAGMQCQLPPSTCLDDHYLTYYTGGACVNDRCQFETQWVYCYSGCWKNVDPVSGDGCSPGFT